MAKVAKAYPAAVYVDCPNCGENVGNPEDGSYLWTVCQSYGNKTVFAGEVARQERTFPCEHCGAEYRLPRSLR